MYFWDSLRSVRSGRRNDLRQQMNDLHFVTVVAVVEITTQSRKWLQNFTKTACFPTFDGYPSGTLVHFPTKRFYDDYYVDAELHWFDRIC